jgi:hypothetical protein
MPSVLSPLTKHTAVSYSLSSILDSSILLKRSLSRSKDLLQSYRFRSLQIHLLSGSVLPSSSSFHRLWFSWFLTRSISSGIFSKYHVYFSFFLCLISVDYYALSLSFSSFFTSFFLVLFLFFYLYIFFPASIFRFVFRKIILSYNFILFYFNCFF